MFIKKLKKQKNKKTFNILLSDKKITGQKIEEILFSKYEKNYLKVINPTLNKLLLKNLNKINLKNYKQI